MSEEKYILITAAYNEAEFIEKTILSVINQIIKPAKWIIVNDGSTDETENIVKKYENQNPFIKLFTRRKEQGRNFASKVFSINYALKDIDLNVYNFIGILDADVSFKPDYYSSLISKFVDRPKLGVAGGIYFDLHNEVRIKVYPSPFSVRGATQFFRRECFQQIGGLVPIKYGGEDGIACASARMYGWEIKNFNDIEVLHLRPTGTVNSNIIKTRFRDGFVEYHLGYHPLFQIVKCFRRVKEKPIFIGSVVRFIGFWWANLKREKRNISKELISFIRKEQISRLIKIEY
jgi:cellulose synthase/poly-beta-1,6-N-acetylglucosamine synthase-like glycosyltransferase